MGLDLQNSISARASSFFVHCLAVVVRLQKCEKAYVCFGKWKSRLQCFCEKRPAIFWPDPFLSLKRCGLKNPQTERRLERRRGSWMCGCTLKIFLSERDAGVRGLNRRIKSKALFGQASTKTVTGQVISKVISPEVMSPEILIKSRLIRGTQR